MTAELYSQVAVAGGWEVIPAQEVDAAMQKMAPTTVGNLDENALQLAHDVSADGVIYGASSATRSGSGWITRRPAPRRSPSI